MSRQRSCRSCACSTAKPRSTVGGMRTAPVTAYFKERGANRGTHWPPHCSRWASMMVCSGPVRLSGKVRPSWLAWTTFMLCRRTGRVEAHTGIAANRGKTRVFNFAGRPKWLGWAPTCGAAKSRWRNMGSSPWARPSARRSTRRHGARTALKWRRPFCDSCRKCPTCNAPGSSCATVQHPVPTMRAARSPQHEAGHMPWRMMRLSGAPCEHAWASLPGTLPALRETWAGWASPKRFALPLRLTRQRGLMRSLSPLHAALPLPHGRCEPCPVNTPLLVCGRRPTAGHCSWPKAGASPPPGTSSRAGPHRARRMT